ncbi:hypothetical protein BZG36_00058 [Bifiguratus adelaidae]|uniref:Dystroglycan-type cadherin-like domain-containing protein n=1 Tax=Bifiguratus adelaidae TaxID=1938954 RepID=A0A261Y8N5_9FUNG|nr:hypothetical protein BZG36_00058 [Bifiguratus adelaidae]
MLLWLVWITAAWAQLSPPTVSIPISSQDPLIARVGEYYSWSFLNTTFSSASALVYSLANGPSWLSVASNQTLYGLPRGSAGTFDVVLSATDSNAGVGQDTFQFAVSANPAPKLNRPIASQLTRATVSGVTQLSLSGNQLVLPTVRSFNLVLEADTFTSTSPLTYSVRSSMSGQLPSWLSFNANNLTFSGMTPSSPTNVTIVVSASDITGPYSAISDSFVLTVTPAMLSAKNTIPPQQLSAMQYWSFQIPYSTFAAGDMVLTNATVAHSVVSNVTLSANPDGTGSIPGWIQFNSSNWTMSGTPSANDTGVHVLFATAQSNGNGNAVATIILLVASNGSIINSDTSIPQQVATRGSWYSYQLPIDNTSSTSQMYTKLVTQAISSTLSDFSTPQIIYSSAGDSPWLQYIAANHTLQGSPPSNASSPVIVLVALPSNSSSGSAAPNSITEIRIMVQDPTSSGSDGSLSRNAQIGIGVGVGLAGLILLVALCWFCFRPAKSHDWSGQPRNPKHSTWNSNAYTYQNGADHSILSAADLSDPDGEARMSQRGSLLENAAAFGIGALAGHALNRDTQPLYASRNLSGINSSKRSLINNDSDFGEHMEMMDAVTRPQPAASGGIPNSRRLIPSSSLQTNSGSSHHTATAAVGGAALGKGLMHQHRNRSSSSVGPSSSQLSVNGHDLDQRRSKEMVINGEMGVWHPYANAEEENVAHDGRQSYANNSQDLNRRSVIYEDLDNEDLEDDTPPQQVIHSRAIPPTLDPSQYNTRNRPPVMPTIAPTAPMPLSRVQTSQTDTEDDTSASYRTAPSETSSMHTFTQGDFDRSHGYESYDDEGEDMHQLDSALAQYDLFHDAEPSTPQASHHPQVSSLPIPVVSQSSSMDTMGPRTPTRTSAADFPVHGKLPGSSLDPAAHPTI